MITITYFNDTIEINRADLWNMLYRLWGFAPHISLSWDDFDLNHNGYTLLHRHDTDAIIVYNRFVDKYYIYHIQ